MTHHHSAQGLASLGRHGDTMLVHMSPHEVAGLNYLAKKQGTKLTINPETGLPEAFSLGGLFSSILPMFAGAMFPGSGFAMEPLLAGALTGGALAAVKGKNPLMGGLMGGLGGISGSNLAQGLGGAAAGAASAGTPYSVAGGWVDPSTIGAMTGPQMPGAALANTGLNTAGASMMNNPVIVNAANTVQGAGFANSAMSGAGNLIDKGLDKIATMGSGAKSLATGQPGAWEGFKNAFIDPTTGTGALTNTQAALKIGMPVGGAILGGLEPSDIYGEPIDMSGAKKKQAYDPYATLNLSGDTGLRLYAMGGTVTTGGLRDLYASTDTQTNPQLSRDGYGVGRLDSLAREQSLNQAQTMGYADGGEVVAGNTGMNLDTSSQLNLNSGVNTGTNSYTDFASLPFFLRFMLSKGKFNFTPISSNKPNTSITPSVVSLTEPQGPGYTEPLYPTGPDYAATELTPQATYAVAKPKFAMGGPVSFADGGDAMKLDDEIPAVDQGMGLSSLTPTPSQAMPTQQVQNAAMALSGAQAQPSDGSIITQVATKLQQNPNYQPQNPIEASIVKQLKGDSGQQGQGIAGLNTGSAQPSQPMAPSYNASQPMGPTYYAGMNAPKGFAEGGNVNPNELSLNLNTGERNYVATPNFDMPQYKPETIQFARLFGLDPATMAKPGHGGVLDMLDKAGWTRHAKGGYLDGPGTGLSDSIPATIEGKQPARLADGEFVISSDVVSALGEGSSKAGSKRLYAMMDRIRQKAHGKKKQINKVSESILPA